MTGARGTAQLSLMVLLLSSCQLPFRHAPVRLDPEDNGRSTRWHATMQSPSALAGAIEIQGTASVRPDPDDDSIHAEIEIRNATPGGEHPWEIHRGRCGNDEGTLASTNAYPPLRIGRDGTAAASTRLPARLIDSGSYFIAVYASQANRQLLIACGNLAPPAG